MKSHTRKAHITIAGQASRILDQGGFAPDGRDLTALLSAHSDKNRTALETWIGETIVREGLGMDHTLSLELDRRLAPLIRYVYPERNYLNTT